MSEVIEKIADFEIKASPQSNVGLDPIILIDNLPLERTLVVSFTLFNIRPNIMYKLRVLKDGVENSLAEIATNETGLTFVKDVNGTLYGNGKAGMRFYMSIQKYGPFKVTLELRDESGLVVDEMSKYFSIEKEE